MRTLALILVAVAVVCSQNIYAQGCLPEGIIFTSQAQIDSFQVNYPGCTEIEGFVQIGEEWIMNDINNLQTLNVINSIGEYLRVENNQYLTSLTGFENISSIGEGLIIFGNNALTSLTELSNLTFIGGSLDIEFNNALQSLTGLEKLTDITGSFYLQGNNILNSLADFEYLDLIGGILVIQSNEALISLVGLEKLTTVTGFLSIDNNDILTDLSSLENLTSIGGRLVIRNNDALTILAGLENIQANSIDSLYIYNNTLLTECDIQCICDYLIAPNGTIIIHDNAPGCNSPEEVILACQTAIDEKNAEALSISPNPATSFITLTTPRGELIKEAIIYNHLGQKVLTAKPENNTVDVSGLKAGMYVLEVVIDNNRSIREKLLVE